MTETHPPRSKMLSVSQVRRQLGVRYDAALALVQAGRIPGERQPNGRWKIPQASVDRYISKIADRADDPGRWR